MDPFTRSEGVWFTTLSNPDGFYLPGHHCVEVLAIPVSQVLQNHTLNPEPTGPVPANTVPLGTVVYAQGMLARRVERLPEPSPASSHIRLIAQR